MKLFIDSGNLKEIEALVPLGIIDGITTNPSLLAKEGGDYRALLKRICDIVQGPTSAEVVATDVDGMLREGRELAKIDKHIVVKVPFTQGRRPGLQDAVVRRHPRQRHADLLGDPGAARGQGRRHLREPVRRPARRHRDLGHEPDQRDRRDFRELRLHAPRSWSPPPAARCTSSRRRAWAPTSAPVRRRSSTRCSSIR